MKDKKVEIIMEEIEIKEEEICPFSSLEEATAGYENVKMENAENTGEVNKHKYFVLFPSNQ